VAAFKESARLGAGEQVSGEPSLEAFGLEATGGSLGKLVAEGDSWFDYLPGTDLIDCLKGLFNYDIENYAKAGDTLENMIFGTGINRRFERVSPQIDTVLKRIGQLQPKVFLFSGGGNDVAGDEFESYLNHKHSGLPALREAVAEQMIEQVFRKYFEDLIARVAARSPDTHIVAHGYGHTVPTGEGVDFLFFTFAGPWLRPALAKKGILDTNEQRSVVFLLIDAYNEMLKSLDQAHAKFHHVDLRSILNPDTDWANELHLKNSAYARSAKQIHDKMQTL
jgi:lysophospholipase L1-like esterase